MNGQVNRMKAMKKLILRWGYSALLWMASLVALTLVGNATTIWADDANGPPAPGDAHAKPRPNILFIFSDDHALQAIGAYGSKINQTPHIDRIAREGMVFDRSFCTNSLCGPSRACILTGKHSHVNGFLRNGNQFDGHQWTFPQQLKKAGYETAVIGKWHLESQPVGFDYWEVLPDQGSYYNPDFIQMDGSLKRYQGYCTDLTTEMALRWLREQRDPSKPFLLMCQHKAPHRNWAPAPRHFALYRDDLPEPSTLHDTYADRSSLLQKNEMTIRSHMYWGHDMKFHGTNPYPQHFLDGLANGEYQRMDEQQRATWDAQYEPENQAFLGRLRAGTMTDDQVLSWKYQRYLKDYLRCVAAVDESVGQMLDYLDREGLTQNTIVIYGSDQGFYLGEHGWYDKRWIYEESLKMPLVVRWPQVVAPGTRSSALVQNIDYASTFLEAAGLEVPSDVQGRSLMPILSNGGKKPGDWRDAVYYAYYENAAVHNVPVHDGIRTDRYKLFFIPRSNEWQLMDLQVDPEELRSFHDDPAYQPIVEALKKRYRDLRKLYQVNSAVIPETRADLQGWRERQASVNSQLKMGTAKWLFIGDSITQGWESEGRAAWDQHFANKPAVNMGFSGDRTQHVIWRLSNSDLSQIQPEWAVVMIGTNNTGNGLQDPEEVAQGIRAIVSKLQGRFPQMQILLLGVFPRSRDPLDPMRLNNLAINDLLRATPFGKQVHYRDIGHVFTEPDGTLSETVMPDGLHLSAEGYDRWAKAIDGLVQQIQP